MNKWKLFRIVLIALVGVVSLFTPLKQQVQPQIYWNELAIIFICIPVVLLFVVGIQAINPYSAKVWRKPNWNINPLNFRDPVHFFHFGAYVMLVQGIITSLRVSFSTVTFYPEAMIALVMGVSILIAVHLIMLAYRSKYREST